MYNLIKRRKTGELSGADIIDEAIHLGTKNFALSKKIRIDSNHQGGVKWLTLDGLTETSLLSCGDDRNIYMYDISEAYEKQVTKKIFGPKIEIKSAHSSVITGVEWNSSDTKRFSSCSYDGRLRYWDITTSKCVQSFSLEFKISNHSVAQNGNHHLISAMGSKVVKICDLRTGSSLHTIQANQGKSIVSKWLPKNEYALVTGGLDSTIKYWDIRKMKSFLFELGAIDNHQKKLHTAQINGLATSTQGNVLVSSDISGRICVWQASTGDIIGSKQVQNYNIQTFPRINELQVIEMQVLEKTETTVFYPNTEQYEIQIVPIDKRYKIGNVEKGIKQVDEKILRYCEEIEDPEMLGVNCLEINSSYKNGRSVLFSGDQVGNIVAWTPENQEIEKARGEVEKDDEWTSD